MEANFWLELGQMELEKTKAPKLSRIIKIMSGNIIRCKLIPALLSATNSYCSPKLPKVIIEDSNTANGKARGTKLAEA